MMKKMKIMKRINGIAPLLRCSIVTLFRCLVVTLAGVTLLLATLMLVGCDNNQEPATAENTVAISVDKHDVYLDEAKYYAYTTQGTYEVYYISEGKDIDWNAPTSGTTMQALAKAGTLDDICRIECFYAMHKEYNIHLDEEKKDEIDKKVDVYFNETNEKLKNKIGIKEKRLKKVFEKTEIAQMVEDIMNAEKQGLAAKYFKEWMDKNPPKCEKCWAEINFNEHIFSKEEIDIIDETTEAIESFIDEKETVEIEQEEATANEFEEQEGISETTINE